MKRVKTYTTKELAIQAAQQEHNLHGWYVAIVPIWRDGKSPLYMLQANAAADMVFSVGEEETL